ncbi:response regulator [Candidatus Nitrospira bockiana]
MPRPRILIIDDDLDTVALLKSSLVREGFEIQAAPDPRTGCDMVDALRPNLVIADLLFPGSDGHVILEHLKSHPDIPVIVLSAAITESQGAEPGAAHHIMYVRKPIRLADVHQLVKQTVAASRP